MTRDTRLYLAWVVALAATIGSLYFSEVLHYQPCVLCWYQRIAMYPQAIILGIAAFTRDYGVRRYAMPLSVIGLVVALLHNAEDWGWVETLKSCSVEAGAVSCTTPWPLWTQTFGSAFSRLDSVLTIPALSLTAFALILLLLAWPRERLPRPGPVLAEGQPPRPPLV